MDEIRLESYSKALVEEFPDDADTLSALDKLSLTPRGEFEPIIPSKVDLIRVVKNMGWARKRAAREAAEAEAERVYAEKLAAERKAGLLEHVDIDGAVKAAVANKARKEEEARQARAYQPTVVTVCQHCGPTAPTSSQDLFALARYYQAKAERAADAEAKLAASPDPIETLVAEYRNKRTKVEAQ